MSGPQGNGPRATLAGVLLGAAAGLGARALFPGSPALAWAVAEVAAPAGQLFLRLLALVAAPLLVAALASALHRLELRELSRIGGRILLLTAGGSAIAALLGVGLFRLLLSGRGAIALLPPPGATAAAAAPGALRLVEAVVPPSPVEAPWGLGLLFLLALLLGVAGRHASPLGAEIRRRVEWLFGLSGRLVAGLLRAAPLGAAALLFAASARLGAEVVGRVGAYAGVVLLGLAVQLLLVHGLAVRWLAGMSPRFFLRGSRLALTTAFATSSSAASLPVALRVAEEELGLPGPSARLVLTTGAAANQHGTALYEGVTLLFLAEVAGVGLSLGQQLLVVAIALPVLTALCGLVGIPAQGLGLLVGVDRLLDMARTTVNVAGDLALAAIVARKER